MSRSASLFPGDRIRYDADLASYGTVLSEPYTGQVSVRLDDGRSLRVGVGEVSSVTARHAHRR